MKYEITIPTFYLIPGFILFIILFYFFIKILIEYEQEKDNLNDKWEKDKAYREFRFQKRLYGNMSQEDIDTVNNLSKAFNLGLDTISNNSNFVQLSENNHNSNLFIEEIKTTIKDNNELALKLITVSAEMGFFKGKLHYIEEENNSLKSELKLTKIEIKKILELNQELLNKEKEILELQLKNKLISIEVQNKDYIIDELKKEKTKINISLIEIKNKLIEVSNMSIFNKIKFKYDKND